MPTPSPALQIRASIVGEGLQLFGYVEGLFEFFEVALVPFDFAVVAEFLELGDGEVGVLCFLR
jgi:hypothetical protein